MLDQQIMTFLKGLTGPEVLPPTQAQANPPIASIVPKTSGNVGSDAFFCPLLGFIITGNELDMLT